MVARNNCRGKRTRLLQCFNFIFRKIKELNAILNFKHEIGPRRSCWLFLIDRWKGIGIALFSKIAAALLKIDYMKKIIKLCFTFYQAKIGHGNEKFWSAILLKSIWARILITDYSKTDSSIIIFKTDFSLSYKIE